VTEQRDADSAAVEKVRATVPGFQKRSGLEVHPRIEVMEIVAGLAEQLDRTSRPAG
jgi:hypothetical protein